MNRKLSYKDTPFSLRQRCRSIRYALQGIRVFFRREHNARIHVAATAVVTALAGLFGVTATEAITLVLATGFVWTAEIFNTSVEEIMNMTEPEQHPSVKRIKDLSAAAVLVAALAALLVGAIVFIPKILLIWKG